MLKSWSSIKLNRKSSQQLPSSQKKICKCSMSFNKISLKILVSSKTSIKNL